MASSYKSIWSFFLNNVFMQQTTLWMSLGVGGGNTITANQSDLLSVTLIDRTDSKSWPTVFVCYLRPLQDVSSLQVNTSAGAAMNLHQKNTPTLKRLAWWQMIPTNPTFCSSLFLQLRSWACNSLRAGMSCVPVAFSLLDEHPDQLMLLLTFSDGCLFQCENNFNQLLYLYSTSHPNNKKQIQNVQIRIVSICTSISVYV